MSQSRKAFLLTISHVVGFFSGMLVPVTLSRHLSVEELGTYRQVTLLIFTIGFVGSLGMDNGLFYFARKRADKGRQASLTCLVFNIVIGALLAVTLLVWRGPFVSLLNNPALDGHLPYLALYLALLLPSQQLPTLLVIRGATAGAMWVNIANAVALAGATIGGYLVAHSLSSVLALLCLWNLVRIGILLRINWRAAAAPDAALAAANDSSTKGPNWWQGFMEQARYSLPLGLANILAMSVRLDRFAVASLYSLAEFTRYSIGCFDLPVLPQTVNNLQDLTSIEVVEAQHAGRHEAPAILWFQLIRRVQLLTLPVIAFACINAEAIIRLVFSDRYADSAAIFRWYSLAYVLTSIDTQILFRAYGKTLQALSLDVLSLALSAACVFGGIRWYGAEGAILGRLLSVGLTFAARSISTARLLGCPARKLLPVKQTLELGLASFVAALAAMKCLTVYHTGIAALDLALIALLTELGFLGALATCGMTTTAERLQLRNMLKRQTKAVSPAAATVA